MAEEGNRRAPVRLADGETPHGRSGETCNLKRQKDLGGGGVLVDRVAARIGTNVALHDLRTIT